jgi:hypothetical protein
MMLRFLSAVLLFMLGAFGAAYAATATQAVYVSDAQGGVFEYPINPDGTLGGSQVVPLSNIGTMGPSAMTFGPAGALYVVDYFHAKVHTFVLVSNMWTFTHSLEPIYHSNSIALDGQGYLYAGGRRGSLTQAQVYPRGAYGYVNPIVVIPGDSSSYCCRVAVWDEQLYISGNGIRVFSQPMSKPKLARTITTSTHFGGPIALDKSSELYVADGGDVLAYSPRAHGMATPDRVIATRSGPFLSSEVGMAVVGNILYVYGYANGGTIWVFNAKQGQQVPLQVVTGIGGSPLAMAVGPIT